MQADSGVEQVSAPELSVEEVWSGAEGPPSIADLALEQKGIYYPLVQHHWLLTCLLHAALTFKIKGKPLSLFDSKVRTHSLTSWIWRLMPFFSNNGSLIPPLPSLADKRLFFSMKELKKMRVPDL